MWSFGAKHLWTLLVTMALLLGAAFTIYYQLNPSIVPNADAWGYVFHAFRFRLNAPLYDFGGVRTYGYPLFLYVITFVSGLDPSRLALAVAIVQYGLFLSAILWLVRGLHDIDRRLAISVFIGLALNPVIVSSVTDVLTEGLSIVFFVALTGFALRISRLGAGTAACVVLGCLSAAIALMVRPGNVVMLIAWYSVLILLTYLAFRKGDRSYAKTLLLFGIAGVAVSVVSVFGPQIAYNYINFRKLGFMPACELGDFQIYTSVFMWKYDTIILPDGQAAGLIYLNPLLESVVDTEMPLLWYFKNPVAGSATLAAHVFNLFSVTTLFTYVRELHPWYDLPLRVFYWAIVLIGLWGGGRALATNYKSEGLYRSGAAAFIALSFAGFVALGSITAVEQRFGVVPLAIVSVLGCYLIMTSNWRKNVTLPLAALLVGVIGCLATSYYMDGLAQRGMGDHQFSFAFSEQCKVTLDGKSWDELFEIFDDMIGR